MPILVVAATALELSAALGARAGQLKGQLKGQLGGAVVPALVHGREVLACVSGLGVINASLALGAALARGGVDALSSPISGVVSLGVAGSFDLDAHPVGSVRLVEKEIWPEYGLLATGWCSADATALGFALGQVQCPADDSIGDSTGNATRSAVVWDRLAWDATAALARLGLCPGPWVRAKSLTVSGVTADQERAELLRARHQADLENMEGFALAYGCAVAGLPFAELRAVSNAVGARPPESWDLPGALAALGQAAELLFSHGCGE
ncbi:MAG: futalosine hydrolase [Humidesulfovibrio sp.]|nr:futalosine hydrolase [Desulfovibrio sp.]MDO9083079.1 futalosine hydrolase [Humidesulfovibrio sp.]